MIIPARMEMKTMMASDASNRQKRKDTVAVAAFWTENETTTAMISTTIMIIITILTHGNIGVNPVRELRFLTILYPVSPPADDPPALAYRIS